MKNNYKEFYDAPSCVVLEIKTEGVICQSSRADVQNYNWNDYVIE